MKKYIILGFFLNLGGGQLYTKNKMDYLESRGWIVDVYTGREGACLIPEMERFENNVISELDYSPYYSMKQRRKKVIEELCQRIVGDEIYDEIVIESSKLPYAMWGELIASRLEAKHVFFCLDEEPMREKFLCEKDFFEFKLRRHELAGITEEATARMFSDYRELAEGEKYCLKFWTYVEPQKESDERIANIAREDINLGCISRLEKEYIIPMSQEIVKLAGLHSDLSFLFVVIGDTDKEEIRVKIQSIFAECKNVKLVLLGYISPIPQNLFELIDYFVGTAGAAGLSARNGKITFRVDTINSYPIGIQFYNARRDMILEQKLEFGTLSEYMNQIIFNTDKEEIYQALNQYNKDNAVDISKDFDVHMQFIEDGDKEKKYFSFDRFGFCYKTKMMIMQVLKYPRVKKIYHIVRSVF